MHTYILRVWINGIQPQESRYRVSGIAVPENWNGGAIWAGFFNIATSLTIDDFLNLRFPEDILLRFPMSDDESKPTNFDEIVKWTREQMKKYKTLVAKPVFMIW